MLSYLKQFAFGLDISSSSVSVLKMAKKGGRLTLYGFQRVFLPAGLIRGGRIQDEKYLSEIIKKAAAGSRPRPINDFFVNLALPEQLSFLQVVQLPKMSFKEAAAAIKWEIEANIPLPIESVYYDWQIMEFPQKIDHLDVLIAAAPKDVVESYVRTAKLAGFYPKSIEIDSFSLCRSIIPSFYSKEPILIVEFSSAQATLVVFSGKAPRFSSTIPLSGRHFAEMAAAEWDSARKIRVKKIISDSLGGIEESGGSLTDRTDSDAPRESVSNFVNFLTEQIRSHKEFYEDHAEHEHQSESSEIKKIMLCGSGIFSGFDRILAKNIKAAVEISNPFTNVSKKPGVDFSLISVEESLALAKVIGLAARDLI